MTINGEKMTRKEYNALLTFIFWLNPQPKKGTKVLVSYRDILGIWGQRGGKKWPKICPKLTINLEIMTKKEYSSLLWFIFWLNPQPKKGTKVPASYRDHLGTLG